MSNCSAAESRWNTPNRRSGGLSRASGSEVILAPRPSVGPICVPCGHGRQHERAASAGATARELAGRFFAILRSRVTRNARCRASCGGPRSCIPEKWRRLPGPTRLRAGSRRDAGDPSGLPSNCRRSSRRDWQPARRRLPLRVARMRMLCGNYSRAGKRAGRPSRRGCDRLEPPRAARGGGEAAYSLL